MQTTRKFSIRKLVSALPEIYQPIYGHPEYTDQASRSCADRLNVILNAVTAFSAHLKRPLRILDLGCAQGFISLTLAAHGAKVVGIDNQKKNIDLCQALQAENNMPETAFLLADIQQYLPALQPGEFDAVLGLSVFHHVCHAIGKEQARKLIASLTSKVDWVIFEAALNSEPAYWNTTLPEDPYWIFQDFAFINTLSSHATHLSKVSRPLLFCSNKHWYLDGDIQTFSTWTTQTHELVGNVYEGTRRYYFTADRIAKLYRCTGNHGELNRSDLLNEQQLLKKPIPGFSTPRLISSSTNDTEGWIVRELIPGTILSTAIVQKLEYDPYAVLLEVLNQLALLEKAGLYHNDVRIWNVLLIAEGKARIIDFGSISQQQKDCLWPFNVYLSFFLFARDVIKRRLPQIDPLREPYISLKDLPAPFDQWGRHLWALPPEDWSFALFRDELTNALLAPVHTVQPSDARDLWIHATEEYLASLNRIETQRQAEFVHLKNELAGIHEHIQHREAQLNRTIRALKPLIRLYRLLQSIFNKISHP